MKPDWGIQRNILIHNDTILSSILLCFFLLLSKLDLLIIQVSNGSSFTATLVYENRGNDQEY